MSAAGPRTADAIVIGGGIHGASGALHLARRGYSVILLERDRLGRHASGANAGSIHHIPRIHFELPLGEAALAAWGDIETLLGDDCGFHRNGYLRVVETEAEAATARDAMDRVRRLCGIREDWLGRDDLRALHPGLADSILGAVWAPDCGAADPARTLEAFRANLWRAAVGVIEGCRVETIARVGQIWECRTAQGAFQAPVLVNCAGAWGADIAALAGEALDLAKEALMMSVTTREPATLGPVVGHVGRRLSVKQAPNGTFLIGGGYRGMRPDRSGHAAVDHGRLAYNLAMAQHVYPPLARSAIVRCWTGIEGFAPDHAAYIGPSAENEGLWHCFGFSAHGFYLGPVVGDCLAEAIATGRVPEPIRPYSPSRSMPAASAPQEPGSDVSGSGLGRAPARTPQPVTQPRRNT